MRRYRVDGRAPLCGCGAMLALAVVGCSGSGQELAPVSGRITLDGKPLAGARIRFQPDRTGGSPSYGAADSSGNYELGFKRGQKGAMIGSHVVSITAGEGVRPLPQRYNLQSELRAEVRPDVQNQFDFKLNSQSN